MSRIPSSLSPNSRRPSFQERYPLAYAAIHVAILVYIVGGAACFLVAMRQIWP